MFKDDQKTSEGEVDRSKEKSLEDNNEAAEGSEEELLEKLENLHVDPCKAETEKPPEAFRMGGKLIATKGNFSLIVGRPKSKKSFFTALLAKSVLDCRFTGQLTASKPVHDNDVLFLDTEQGGYHAGLQAQRIYDPEIGSMGSKLHYYTLRRLKTQERFHSIEVLLKKHSDTGIVILDGVRDIASGGVNDEMGATEISDLLLRLSEEYKVHIVTVLHQNKGDSNARGHLGSELVHKAETTLSVESVDANVSTVTAEYCRNTEPPAIAFQVVDGRPSILTESEHYLGEHPNRRPDPEEVSGEKHRKILERMRMRKDEGTVKGKDLKKTLSELVGEIVDGKGALGDQNCRRWWEYYKDVGVLVNTQKRGWWIGEGNEL